MGWQRRAGVFAIGVAALTGSRGCGFDAGATGPAPTDATGDPSRGTSASGANGVVDGGASAADGATSVVDSSLPVGVTPPPCTICSETCPDACPICSGGDRYCISASSCAGDCSKCTTGSSYCNVCDADGGGPRRVCGSRTSGFCGSGTYAHCPCVTEQDCGSRQVCSGGLCRLCGEPGSDGFKCSGCDTCSASTGDCHC